MLEKKSKLEQLTLLSWDDMEEWAGSRIVARGRNYQRQGRVRDLAVTEDGALVAWVDGTRKYATRVIMGDHGLPDSICSCPYGFDCKHAVAVVIEYLKRIEDSLPVSKAKPDDLRLKLLEGEDPDDEMKNSMEIDKQIDQFVKGKTKAQLIELIHDIASQNPDVAREIVNRQQLASGNIKKLVERLRCEIRLIGDEPGWQDYWRGEGYTPDYSGIRKDLQAMLDAGHADDVLELGRELVSVGMYQVEQSHDDGETAMEIAACMPILVDALDRSSLNAADRLQWALDVELEDQFSICEDFAQYLHRRHPKLAWNTLADRLLLRLKEMKGAERQSSFTGNYERNRLTDWIVHAFEQAGRKNEIISLCEAEAVETGSYERLVGLLISARRYREAERWILEGIAATGDRWPGIASGLRDRFREIRTRQKDWQALAAIAVENFVRRPSKQAFKECQKSCSRIKVWPEVRKALLQYLETGELPWKRKGWPLAGSGLDQPQAEQKDRYPMTGLLIEIAIMEKQPDRVLYWYNRLARKGLDWYGFDEDKVATAIQTHVPDKAVAIWKKMAERLIAQVKPKAYREAGRYLQKAAKVMDREKKQEQWKRYLQELRRKHARKIRLIEVLDSLGGKPILKRR